MNGNEANPVVDSQDEGITTAPDEDTRPRIMSPLVWGLLGAALLAPFITWGVAWHSNVSYNPIRDWEIWSWSFWWYLPLYAGPESTLYAPFFLALPVAILIVAMRCARAAKAKFDLLGDDYKGMTPGAFRVLGVFLSIAVFTASSGVPPLIESTYFSCCYVYPV